MRDPILVIPAQRVEVGSTLDLGVQIVSIEFSRQLLDPMIEGACQESHAHRVVHALSHALSRTLRSTIASHQIGRCVVVTPRMNSESEASLPHRRSPRGWAWAVGSNCSCIPIGQLPGSNRATMRGHVCAENHSAADHNGCFYTHPVSWGQKWPPNEDQHRSNSGVVCSALPKQADV